MVKRAKKPRNHKVKERRRISAEAINYMFTLTEAILRSEFHFDDEKIARFVHAVNQYSGYICDNRTGITFEYLQNYNKHKGEEK